MPLETNHSANHSHPGPGFYTVDLFDCPPFQMFSVGDSHRAVEILELGRFEPTSMRLWCKLARTASRIIDIGAQEGIYAMAAAALRDDCPIDAFEPNPDAYARLRLHCVINGWSDRIHCHRQAVADAARVAWLSWVRKGSLISSGAFLGLPWGSTERVPCATGRLDQLLTDMKPGALIKIDVEGAEEAVLDGMGGHLAQKPDIILETFSTLACNAWNAFTGPLGYRYWKIYETDGRIEPVDRLTPCERDSLNFNHFLSCREQLP